MSSKLALRNIHWRLIKDGGGLSPLTVAAVLHGHRGQLEAEEANKTAHSPGEANDARPSTVTGVW